jgi:predicted ArsR family transcriptional regulator
VSENHERPEIGRSAAEWARRFVIHQTRRMLFMAQAFVADNPFHAECLKFMQKLREAAGQELAHSVLLKRMKMDAKSFSALVTTLEQRGDIVNRIQSTSGRPSRFYRLVE